MKSNFCFFNQEKNIKHENKTPIEKIKTNLIEKRKKTSSQVFLTKLPQYTIISLATVPFECLAVRRVFDMLDFPTNKPDSYLNVIKEQKLKGLFAGAMSRTIFCLAANWVTLQGMDWFGSNPFGLLLTAAAKEVVLPLSLISNARQTRQAWDKTYLYTMSSLKDPVIHQSFFYRNLLSNACLYPGLIARNYCYQMMNECNTQIPNAVGFSTTVLASTIMNSFLKPFITGKYPVQLRWMAALTFPAAIPISLREAASMALIFGSSSPSKKS